jgi:hypothetical protein
MSYDTRTQQAEVYLFDRNGAIVYPYGENEYRPIIVKTHIPGSYAVDKSTGKKIQD